ncbi:hypothetical protein D9Q98_006904 [Chlorella vulgaris]|uniref:YjgF-like protein n=1 Tax=Chlorella vulgaris TaxID=3077 RepID=A0A9D4TJ31_CHLVU|nr:hypothetical protein D9Q98_006904 [Chlorella vulgaris]
MLGHTSNEGAASPHYDKGEAGSGPKSPTAAPTTPLARTMVDEHPADADARRAVRFTEAGDNLQPHLQDSRSSSLDSLHRTYDAALEGREAPPAASGFHVSLTAGGRLETVSSSARWEDLVGYSRAAKRGPFIFVSGTSAVDQASGRVLYRRDAYKQTRLAFTIVERALEQVGSCMEDVVRTRLFVRNLRRDGEAISRAHGEVLGHVKPASSMVEVSRLVHEDILVLVEVDAILGSVNSV